MSVNRKRSWMGGLVLACMAGTAMSASGQQVLLSEDFENGNNSGWTSTGDGQLNGGGNPGTCLYVPLSDWYWITLGTDQQGNAATGDLTRHGGPLTFATDIQVITLNNWFNKPMDPSEFPVVIQFVDAGDPTVSVYWAGPGMPSQSAGWVRYTFEVPDPTSATLPPGWGGTGDEDPVTFEPRLPQGYTYTSVLRNVGEVRITTAVPGYFYIPSFWEAGFDNLEITVGKSGGACYANCDGSTIAPVLNVNDFVCFQQRFAAGDSYANCDGSTVAPVLNVNDFVCFQQRFAAGCP